MDGVASVSRDSYADTRLGRWLARQTNHVAGESGFRLLHSGLDAFVARAGLIDLADKSLDLQYYIFRHDNSGALIIDRLIAAAERGVTVRLLLDDWGTWGRNGAAVAALDAHPKVEIRLFNPYVVPRTFRILREMGSRFGRMNRRMHNKMLVADQSAVVLGGRNIGNEYFGVGDILFQDIDVLGLGPIAKESSVSFDAYWNSDFAVPVVEYYAHAENRLIVLKARKDRLFGPAHSAAYTRALEESDLSREFRQHDVKLQWTRGTLLYDPPAKLAAPVETSSATYLGAQVSRHAELSSKEWLVISPYFVPGKEGVEYFGRKKAAGLEVRILTNSLAATDAWLVHAVYRKYRPMMLRKGISIFELKPEVQKWSRTKGLFKASRSSLHGKTFVFDRTSVFIGTLNIDPRSLRQNTECGVLIENVELATQVADLFERWSSAEFSYGVRLRKPDSRSSRVEWTSNEGSGEVVYQHEPKAGIVRRMLASLFSFLPLESQV